MKFTNKKLSMAKISVLLWGLFAATTSHATVISDQLFVDQLYGMTRLERLETNISLQSDAALRTDGISDAVFVNKMFSISSHERLVMASNVERSPIFNNGRPRILQDRIITLAPYGFYRLCSDKSLAVCNKSHGKLQTNGHGQVLMSPQLLASLQRVNVGINQDIKPEYEKAGTKDNWQVNLAKGDCEDYALTKKTKLLGQGWPSDALLITIVDTEYGERHAVLTVSTNRGDYILDNLMSKVINVEISKYKFLTRQGIKSKFSWTRLV